MSVLSIKVPTRKKSGNLFNDPRIYIEREKEKEREGQSGRQTDRDRQTETDRQREGRWRIDNQRGKIKSAMILQRIKLSWNFNFLLTVNFIVSWLFWVLRYGCNVWTLWKHIWRKKLDGNYTRMLRVLLNKFWK